MFLNIQIDLITLKIFDQQFTLTTKNHCISSLNLVYLGVMAAWFSRKEVESAAAVGLCCTHNACAPMHCIPERRKAICDVLDSV